MGLTEKEMSQFYSVLDNDKKGLQVGKTGVLLVDDTPSGVIPNYTLICYYGDRISPVIKAVYKISEFNYNIYNQKKYAFELLTKWEELGLNDKQIRNALQDILVDTEGVFKKYNRKTHRFNTLARSAVRNNQANLRVNTNQSNGTGVSGGAGTTVSAGKGTHNVIKNQDRDYLSAVERGDMETAQRMVDEAAQAAGYNTSKLYHITKSQQFIRWFGDWQNKPDIMLQHNLKTDFWRRTESLLLGEGGAPPKMKSKKKCFSVRA